MKKLITNPRRKFMGMIMQPPSYVKNERLLTWVSTMQAHCKPDFVYWCDGSEQEHETICRSLVASGTFIPSNPEKRPNSFLARSDPSDVARVEDRTFICSRRKDRGRPHQQLDGPAADAGHPRDALRRMHARPNYCTVIPFSMGPIGSPMSYIGVELTDSAYVVENMRIMTRMGTKR